MHRWMLGFFMLLILFLSACTPRIYGVPEERWKTMSEQERIAAMEAYTARQEALRQRREEQARLRAIEKKAQLAREAEEARRRQRQVDAIYRGEGLYGDLLRVTLEGGMLQFYGAHKHFHPLSFKIAAGEIKDIEIVSLKGRKAHMTVQYDGSNLLLDESLGSHRSNALRLPYEDSWERGATYANNFAKGPLEMRGVNVTVQIVGHAPRDHRRRRHRPHETTAPSAAKRPKPEAKVNKRPAPRPKSEVAVVDKHHRPHETMPPPSAKRPKPEAKITKWPALRPKPEAAVVEKRHQPLNPDVIVIEPPPKANKPGTIIEFRPHKKDELYRLPDRIKVIFRQGRLKLNKRAYSLVPQTVVLRKGQVRTIIIRSQKGILKIQAGYLEGGLEIDDSPVQEKRPIRIGFIQSWKKGQSYLIKASANEQLEDIDLFIIAE